MKRIFKLASILGLGGLVAGCNSFLDKEPDNRASIDNLDKVSALLVSAYPNRTNMSLLDPRCDYIVDMGATLDGSQPSSSFDFVVSGFMWDEYTRSESSNDTYEQYWTSVYEAISAANHALAAIETLPTSEQANAGKQRAEALMTRAYNHFTLLTMYANMFDSKFADVNTNMNPGVPYVTEPEDVVICLQSNDQVINVYSGIERYIRHIGNSQPDTDTDSFWANGNDFAGKYLILFDVRGNLSVDNGDRSGAYPFFTLPVVSKLKFTAPTIKDSGTY